MPNPRVFLDFQIEGSDVGRVVCELFADRVPKTVANFKALCTGSAGVNTAGVPLTYKGSPLHRIIAGPPLLLPRPSSLVPPPSSR